MKKGICLTLCVCLLWLCAGCAPRSAAVPDGFEATLILDLADGTTREQVDALGARFGFTPTYVFGRSDLAGARFDRPLTAEQAEALQNELAAQAAAPLDGVGFPEAADGFALDAPAEEILRAAKRQQGYLWVVMEDGVCTAGGETFDAFRQTVAQGRSAVVRIAAYYTLQEVAVSADLYKKEKNQYPQIFLITVVYDATADLYTVGERPSGQPFFEMVRDYRYLQKMEEQTDTGERIVRYALVNDESVTWEQIVNGMLSSRSDDWVEHYTLLVER